MKDEEMLKPRVVFDCFSEVNRIPRPSKREEKMIAFLKAFGEGLKLETKVDETGNVLIRKPATPGCEKRRTVILQSHMDMVCEKNADVDFDFMNDAIQTETDGEWLKARGTTLGADDGIGVAMQMALLKSNDIEHGPLECVFTRDEETGLTGAAGGAFHRRGLGLHAFERKGCGRLRLGIFLAHGFVSCAGGARTTAEFPCPEEPVPAGYYFFQIGVKGLTGGHSGDDINKKRANANKLLVRFLCDEMEKTDLRLVDIQSGGLHNAIPREGRAVCAVPMDFKETLRVDLNLYHAAVGEEYAETEPAAAFTLESVEPQASAMERTACRLRCGRFTTAFLP